MIVVLWGVSGCGKSTVGARLAVDLNWTFHDADDFHPATNVTKMRNGVPLEDTDRYPWLAQLKTLLCDINARGAHTVLACSALKQNYRDRLGINQVDVCGVHLSGTQTMIQTRLAQRNHKFMNDQLLASQFEALEESATGLQLDIGPSPRALSARIVETLSLEKSL